MIDHTGLTVSDVTKSREFYRDALAPLGYTLLVQLGDDAGFGVAPKPDFGIRPHYHPNYYCAFVLDPDGHNIEAVCHAPA